MNSVGGRRRARVIAGVLAVLLVVGLGVWWLRAPLPAEGLSALSRADAVFPQPDDLVLRPWDWDCEFYDCGEEPVCDDVVCSRNWFYAFPSLGPEDAGRNAQGVIRVFGERFLNVGNAVWFYHWWRPPGWVPWETVANEEELASLGHADAASVQCYYNRHWDAPPKDGHGCVWKYWARYGQYIIALSYGSEGVPLTFAEFESTVVRPFDEYLQTTFDL